jgi:hypothetical protein
MLSHCYVDFSYDNWEKEFSVSRESDCRNMRPKFIDNSSILAHMETVRFPSKVVLDQ